MVINLGTATDKIFERTETLKRYYDDIRSYKTLTKEEELALIDVYHNGNDNEKKLAQDKLIEANQRFVVAVAKRYATKENLLDLISEGNIGLIEALNDFDTSKDVKFTTFAVYYIRRAINYYNVEFGSIVKKNNKAKTYHLLSKATNDFVQQYHREPTNEELFDLLNEKYNANLKNTMDVTPTVVDSIDEDFGKEDDPTNLGDMAMYNAYSASTNSYETAVNGDYIHNMVSSLLSILTPREQTVVKMAFGVGDYYREYKNEEIADEVGLTKERVRQMKASCIERMKKEYFKRIAKA